MGNQTLSRIVLYTLSMVLFAVSGCYESLSGNESNVQGELKFDDEPSGVAVDTEVTFRVSDSGRGEPFESLAIEPESDAVEVISKSLSPPDHPSFTIRASRTGLHAIQLRAELESGRDLQRTFEIWAEKFAGIEIKPLGQEPQFSFADPHPTRPYLVDSEAHILYRPQGPHGGTLAGVEYRPVWEPMDALSLDESASEGNRMVFQTGSKPEVVTLKSEPGSAIRDIELITPAMVEDLVLAERARGLIEPGDELHFTGLVAAHIVPVYDGVTIIDNSLDVSLRSETPDVCAVLSDDRSEFETETGDSVLSFIDEHWPGDGFVVDVRETGECRLHAEYPEANGGSGAELREIVQIDG